jgi:predicted small lipoprotein YifL
MIPDLYCERFMPEHRCQKQVLRLRRAIFAVLLLVLAMPLAACGKKAGELDPPPGAENLTFPRTYPDPSTDPKPEAPETP